MDGFERRNIERARNTQDFTWAGDPTRWGGAETFDVAVTSSVRIVSSGQLLRAQTAQLVACGWDLVATWSMQQVSNADDFFELFLRVALGTGQSTSTLLWKLSEKAIGSPPDQQNAGAVTLGWFPEPLDGVVNGVAVSAQPIIASSLNVTALLAVKHSGGGANHRIRVTVNAHCAPRSWVP